MTAGNVPHIRAGTRGGDSNPVWLPSATPRHREIIGGLQSGHGGSGRAGTEKQMPLPRTEDLVGFAAADFQGLDAARYLFSDGWKPE